MHYIQNLIQNLNLASLGDAAARVVCVLLCLTVHETCHGLAAYALGDPTAKSMHRLSLNPLRHIDWLGLLMMFTVGFGWAKPVPVDPRCFKDPKRGMALTALAGPASNLVLAALALLICRPLLYAANTSAAAYAALMFLLQTALLSIGLGLFNLLPIPPLDGSKVLGALLPDRAYFTLMRYERYGMLVLILLSLTNVGGGAMSGAIGGVFQGMTNLFWR